jgi:hypothetical protein
MITLAGKEVVLVTTADADHPAAGGLERHA